MSHQADIDKKARVESFLADPAVQEALGALETRYQNQIRKAEKLEDAAPSWHRLRMLDDFRHELRVIIDRGTAAAHAVVLEERMQARRSPTR